MRILLSLGLVMLLSSMLYAGDKIVKDSQSLKPVIPKGKGEQCVAEPDFMRRNHMDLLKHDRDLTMYQGLRDIDFSLKGCIDCHVVADDQGKALTVKDERHFCRSCHDFAAVKVDCFQCHASKPGIDDKTMPNDKNHQAIMQNRVKKVSKP